MLFSFLKKMINILYVICGMVILISDAQAVSGNSNIFITFLDSNGQQFPESKNRNDGTYSFAPIFINWIKKDIYRILQERKVPIDKPIKIKVKTTLDTRLQRYASAELHRIMKEYNQADGINQGALVSMDKYGAIGVMVDSRKFQPQSPIPDLINSPRASSMSFAPYVYLTALEKGYTPTTIIHDAPYNCREANYGNGYIPRYKGAVKLQDAVSMGLQSATWKLSEKLGIGSVVDTMARLGISVKQSCAMIRGDHPISLLQNTKGYAVFANNGKAVKPYGILQIWNDKDKLVYSHTHQERKQVFKYSNIRQLNAMLANFINNGFGTIAKPKKIKASGMMSGVERWNKKDGWFIGYTEQHVAGVWLANKNSGRMRVDIRYVPAVLWRDFISFAQVNTYRDEGKLSHGHKFQDCPDCPAMIVIRGGEFMMGSSENEKGHQKDESPQHKVSIKKLAVGQYEVTRKEYKSFLKETGYKVQNECFFLVDGKPEKVINRPFLNNGYPQINKHPATCISWYDAIAYTKWLSRKTGKKYRLLTESEWEYVARVGSLKAYFFGNNEEKLCDYAQVDAPCKGQSKWLAKVGSHNPNKFGLYDVHGNVGEWVQDKWHANYKLAPNDGAARIHSSSTKRLYRTLRSGSWMNLPYSLRSAKRFKMPPSYRAENVGFRVARTILAYQVPKKAKSIMEFYGIGNGWDQYRIPGIGQLDSEFNIYDPFVRCGDKKIEIVITSNTHVASDDLRSVPPTPQEKLYASIDKKKNNLELLNYFANKGIECNFVLEED